MAKILIKNGRIWDGERFLFADLLCSGTVVEKLAPGLDDAADFVYDAAGKTVSAGLVDCHVHMKGISSDRFGFPASAGTLPFGVTAAADAAAMQGDERLTDTFPIKTAVFVTAAFRENRADFSGAERMRAAWGSRVVGIKAFFDAADAPVTDEKPLMQVCDYARERGLRVMVHSSNSPIPMARLLDILSPGDILTHAFHGGRHHAGEDDFAAIERAKSRGITIDTGCAGHVHTDFGIFGQAIARGILPDTISSDLTLCSAYMRGGRYGLTLCMSLARTLGMKEEDILRAVTASPARALNKEAEWGHLAPGRAADLCVLELADEPFSLTNAAGHTVADSIGYRCHLTVADGQILYRR